MSAQDEVLLHQILDVLDVRVKVDETILDLADDAVDQLVDLTRRQVSPGRLDRFEDRRPDPLLVEVGYLTRPLDDPEFQHL